MKIYDISQEIFSCEVYPGDTIPAKKLVETIESNGFCNITDFTMCAHNGTHIDAPFHFYKDGKTIDQLKLDALVGKCFVTFQEGNLSDSQAEAILEKARKLDEEAAKRILIGGDVVITLEAAQVFSREGILLIGNESQSIGPMDEPAAVHYELLAKEIVLLEGIRLDSVKEGVYLLNAAPLNLGGCDGSPCRAILIQFH